MLRLATRVGHLSRPNAERFLYTRRPVTRIPLLRRTVVTTRFTKDHESISYDDQTQMGSVRITVHAQESLGDVVFVELPSQNTTVKQGDEIGAVESVKAASDIYAPVSGEILEINSKLGEKPGSISTKNESDNWLCKIKLSDPSEFEALMTEEEYEKHCETESDS